LQRLHEAMSSDGDVANPPGCRADDPAVVSRI
jgi:hypothetical protein